MRRLNLLYPHSVVPSFTSSLHSYCERIVLNPTTLRPSCTGEPHTTALLFMSLAHHIPDWKSPMEASAPSVGFPLQPPFLLSLASSSSFPWTQSIPIWFNLTRQKYRFLYVKPLHFSTRLDRIKSSAINKSCDTYFYFYQWSFFSYLSYDIFISKQEFHYKIPEKQYICIYIWMRNTHNKTTT